jgi:hypothetical protein
MLHRSPGARNSVETGYNLDLTSETCQPSTRLKILHVLATGAAGLSAYGSVTMICPDIAGWCIVQ